MMVPHMFPEELRRNAVNVKDIPFVWSREFLQVSMRFMKYLR